MYDGRGSGRICNNQPLGWNHGMPHFPMYINELTPHNQATGLANSSLASAGLKILSKAESAHHNRLNVSEQSDLDAIVTAYLNKSMATADSTYSS